jgi:hypothetical protein
VLKNALNYCVHMRKVKNALLALSICAISSTGLRAQDSQTAYNLDIRYTNSTAQYWSVNGGPSTTGTSFLGISPSGSYVQTDGSGKISGGGELTVTYNTSGLPFSVFYVDYVGRVVASATVPTTVTMLIKGRGYSVDGSGLATAINNSISLKFIGAPGVNPLNKNQTRIVGTLSGKIFGSTPLGNNPTLPTVQAVFTGSRADFVRISPDVLQTTRRMSLFDSSYGGLGIISGSTYKFNGRGYGLGRGALLTVSGFMGTYTNMLGTNAVGFTAPISADLKGKVQGQIVSGTAAPNQIDPNLIY